MSWNDGLEPESSAFAIASSEASRLRVIAGPGTGKSFAMKRRVARLLESGVDPSAILAVTFTRVAAEDLHRELVQMDVAAADQLRATTLHSLALRALMRAHVLAATGRYPRPLNEFEIKPLEADLAPSFGGLREVRKKLKAFEAAWARKQDDEPGVMAPGDLAFETALVAWLTFHRSMMIGEVIPQFLGYLRQNPHAPERNEYTHVLVDEYQDLNRAEQELISLVGANAEICIVGDDDQSIYSFRHAHPEGIREWCDSEGPQPTDLSLAECRRCPTRVVRMANSLIKRNQNRDGERALVEREANGEGQVRILRYGSVADEVQGIANIAAQFVQHGTNPGDILILAQRGVIGTPIYERLVELGVPAVSYYAEAELDTDFAQERYAYFRLFADQDDRVALRWLVGLYSAAWNQAGYRRVREYCEQSGLSPWQALEALKTGELHLPYTGPLVVRFEEVEARINHLQTLQLIGGLQDVIDDLFPSDEQRVRDLRAVMLATLAAEPDLSAHDFLLAVNEAITTPEIPENVADVRIMSLHKSKGLSAPVTIIAGCIEGLLPRQPSDDLSPDEKRAALEEQRRLFYVGITRVKSAPEQGIPGTLVLSSAGEMPLADAMKAGISPAQVVYGTARLLPSRFLREFDGNAPNAVHG
jgi:superfamily I DNA/RNA helicase